MADEHVTENKAAMKKELLEKDEPFEPEQQLALGRDQAANFNYVFNSSNSGALKREVDTNGIGAASGMYFEFSFQIECMQIVSFYFLYISEKVAADDQKIEEASSEGTEASNNQENGE